MGIEMKLFNFFQIVSFALACPCDTDKDPCRAMNWTDCQGLCALYYDCYYWSWHKDSKVCTQKKKSGWSRQRNSNYISGSSDGKDKWDGYVLSGGDLVC